MSYRLKALNGDYIGNFYAVFMRDTRSVDYGSYGR